MSAASTRAAPRVGFVGLGWAGQHRLAKLVSSGAASVTALLDANPEAVARAAKIAPGARACASLDELLASGVDGVVISTPNALHAEQCLQAFEAGAHVFCQKPLGRSADEVREIVDAAEKRDRLLSVDLCYRHVDGMEQAHALVAAGGIGDVFAGEAVFHNAYGPDKPWFYDVKLAGGGCVLDLGIHVVDLALWTLGWPRVDRVTARVWQQGKPVARGERVIDDFATATLDLATGASIQIGSSWRSSFGRDAVIALTLHGTKGAIHLENVGGSYFDFRVERREWTRRETISEPQGDAWSARPILDWAQRLRSAPGFDEEARRNVDVMDVLDRMYGA